jgi:hypothetical protein
MRELVKNLDSFLGEATKDFIDFKDINLVQEYTRLNRMLFGDKLGIYPMKWNKRKTSGGFVRAKRSPDGTEQITDIQFSTFFATTYQVFLNRLAHEMIHVYLAEKQDAFASKDSQRHGTLFKSEMKRINGMGKGFNIVKSERRENDVVNRSGKKKRYGVLLIDGPNDRDVIVFNDKALEGAFDSLLTFPQGWLERYKLWFFYSMDDFLARYPVKRKIGKRFGTYDISKEEWEKVYKTGMPYASIVNGVAKKNE